MTGLSDLLSDCVSAGIVFYPAGGRLRPKLTAGPITPQMKKRVEDSAESLRQFFAFAFDWPDDVGEDAETLSVVPPDRFFPADCVFTSAYDKVRA